MKTYGYGCSINYEQAINWFERAAGLRDARVSDKAYKAMQELRELVDRANTLNEQTLDALQARNEP